MYTHLHTYTGTKTQTYTGSLLPTRILTNRAIVDIMFSTINIDYSYDKEFWIQSTCLTAFGYSYSLPFAFLPLGFPKRFDIGGKSVEASGVLHSDDSHPGNDLKQRPRNGLQPRGRHLPQRHRGCRLSICFITICFFWGSLCCWWGYVVAYGGYGKVG